MSDTNIDSVSKWETYGNNYFVLSTNVNGTTMRFDGVMSELPAVSMSTEWGNTPTAEIGEKLEDLLNNDLLQFMALNAPEHGSGKMQAMDAMTARMYKGCTPPKFDLKFRCYSGQKIGPHPMRNAGEWKLFLALTTPPNAQCGFSISNVIEQFGGALAGVEAFFSALGRDKDEKKEGEADTPATPDSRSLKERAAGSQIGYDEKNTKIGSDFTSDTAAQKGMQEIETAIKNYSDNANYGSGRAFGSAKTFGANLFQLKIYPFVFKQPLTVYIDSWSVTPSREWNTDTNDHYYYDFTVSCTMDQVLCAKSWLHIIG